MELKKVLLFTGKFPSFGDDTDGGQNEGADIQRNNGVQSGQRGVDTPNDVDDTDDNVNDVLGAFLSTLFLLSHGKYLQIMCECVSFT